MNPAVNALFAGYLEHTGGDKAAAASLTLAAVLMDDRATPPAAQTAEEAARRLGVNRETIYRLSREGKLRGCRVGKAIRFPLEEVERFEREGGVAPPRQATPPAPFKRFTINRRRTQPASG